MSKESINGHWCSVFQEGPPKIYLRDDGKFTAQVAGRWIVRASAKSIKQATAKGVKVLHVFHGLAGQFEEAWVQDLKVGFYIDSEGKRRYRNSRIYLYDEARMKELETLHKEWQEVVEKFERREKDILCGTVAVTTTNFRELLEKKGVTP